MHFIIASIALLICAVSDPNLPAQEGFTDKFAFWHQEYASACSDSISRDRPLFIVFSSLESDLGRSVRAGLFMSESVEQKLRASYVRLHVDLATESGQSLAKKFQVGVEPSFVMLDRSAKWTIFEHAGSITEADLIGALGKYRRSKLGANGKPLKTSSENRSGVTTIATKIPTDSLSTAGYRVPIIRNIEESAFEREVIEQSKERAVVVDFWAEWCGPCRALGPVLERHIRERDGEFILVKVNVDHAPNLTARYRVESIPAVKIFRDGKPVFEFVGSQSDADLRQILDRLRPTQSPQFSRSTEPEPTRR